MGPWPMRGGGGKAQFRPNASHTVLPQRIRNNLPSVYLPSPLPPTLLTRLLPPLHPPSSSLNQAKRNAERIATRDTHRYRSDPHPSHVKVRYYRLLCQVLLHLSHVKVRCVSMCYCALLCGEGGRAEQQFRFCQCVESNEDGDHAGGHEGHEGRCRAQNPVRERCRCS